MKATCLGIIVFVIIMIVLGFGVNELVNMQSSTQSLTPAHTEDVR